jgi:hypothetical protein
VVQVNMRRENVTNVPWIVSEISDPCHDGIKNRFRTCVGQNQFVRACLKQSNRNNVWRSQMQGVNQMNHTSSLIRPISGPQPVNKTRLGGRLALLRERMGKGGW